MISCTTLIGSTLRFTGLQYLPIRVRHGEAKGAWWTIYPFSSYWRGVTEPETELTLQRDVYEGGICYDLGTHFGIYTIGMAKRVGPTGRVYGFEPNPVSFKRCQLHIRWNHLEWVELRNAAVSDAVGNANLIVESGEGTPFSHFAMEDEDTVRPSAGGRKEVQVPKLRIDDLVDSGQMLPPHFIKVDVEGHGAHALSGAINTIKKSLPIILMAFHSRWEQENTRKQLEPLGYRPFDCTSTLVTWQNEYAVLRPNISAESST